MSTFCAHSACPQLVKAVELFSRQAYIACHEELEALWLDETGPEREFYRGLLQVAVGLHHARNGNGPGSLRGATSLLTEGWERLAPFAPACQGLDLGTLGRGVETALQSLAAGNTDFPAPTLTFSATQSER